MSRTIECSRCETEIYESAAARNDMCPRCIENIRQESRGHTSHHRDNSKSDERYWQERRARRQVYEGLVL